jgi:hypothetical protein
MAAEYSRELSVKAFSGHVNSSNWAAAARSSAPLV